MPTRRVCFPLSNLKQTILPFQPIQIIRKESDLSSDADHSSQKRYKLPPSLPDEIWVEILSRLGNFALKKFRLVCSEWSLIGADWLFRILYLDSYERSWSGLVLLAESEHAHRVRQIEWNALVFFRDSDDPAIWAARYDHLLSGLSYRDTFRYHQAYEEACRKRWRQQPTSFDAAAQAIRKLSNCHSLLIKDNHDLSTNCDRSIREGIAKQPEILRHVTTWALGPPISPFERWDRRDERTDILETGADILVAMLRGESVDVLQLDIWEDAFEFVLAPWLQPHRPNPRPELLVTTLDCRFRTADRPIFKQLEWTRPRFHTFYTKDMMSYVLRCFTNIVNLSWRFALVHELRSPTLQTRTSAIKSDASSAGSDDYTTDQDDSEDVPEGEEGPPFVDGRPDGCTEEVARSFYAYQTFDFTLLPNLRNMNLCDISFNARSLLCFLSCQPQLKETSISLRLSGTVLLYDTIPKLFLAALAQLNVTISYQSNSTFYFEPAAHVQLSDDPEETDHHPWIRCFHHSQRPRKLWLADPAISATHTLDEAPLRMPPCPDIALQKRHRSSFEIIRRPHQFRFAVEQPLSVPHAEISQSQVYRLRIEPKNHTIWEWVSLKEAMDPISHIARPHTFTLLLLKSQTPSYDGDDYGYYYYEDYAAEQAEAFYDSDESLGFKRWIARMDQRSILRAQVATEYQEYKMMRQYETELLGLDIREMHFDIIANRALLGEQRAFEVDWEAFEGPT